MASFFFNAGAHAVDNGSVDFLTDVVKVLLLGNATPWTPDKDAANLTTIAASELTGIAGYIGGFAGAGRKALASKVVTLDTATDRDKFDADDPTPWTLAVGETVTGMIVYFPKTNDADSIPFAYIDLPDTPTFGGAMQVAFDANGIGYSQQ